MVPVSEAGSSFSCLSNRNCNLYFELQVFIVEKKIISAMFPGTSLILLARH